MTDDDLTIDSGFVKNDFMLQGFIMLDYDDNGTYTPSHPDEYDEVGRDITVILRDENGVEINRITTNDENNSKTIPGEPYSVNFFYNDGEYLFPHLKPGRYTVEVIPPEGYRLSDYNAYVTPFRPGEDGESHYVNEGIRIPINIERSQFNHFTLLTPDVKVGDTVWEDTNKDGIQDANEPGIANVTVVLKDEQGAEVSTTTTDANGHYLFDQLKQGHYTVEFVTPEGYTPTLANQGSDDANDSDGSTVEVDLHKSNLTVDAGFYKETYEIGDKVWNDTNEDGVQDEDEPGLSGVTVILKDHDGNTVETKTTDDNGEYHFSNVPPGDYTVEFVTPDGYQPSASQQGTDPEKDSNGTTVNVHVDHNDESVDVGFHKVKKYKIGDFVWIDAEDTALGLEDSWIHNRHEVDNDLGYQNDSGDKPLADVPLAD
ncbi:MAG: SdrD B-like domain-containing protein, partial [Staphylococcus rostri]|uniref:SdrD B-like domain-containing protein n=1 Tax=Staphylococcus rostri TaxID=522262 RepID=UPI0026E0419D